MKYVVTIVAIAMVFYVCFQYRSVIDKIRTGGTPLGASIDADSLDGKALQPFAMPRGHCKASFPGEPRIPGFGQELISGVLYSGKQYMIADKEMNYYLSELSLPSMAMGFGTFSGIDSSAFSGVNFGSRRGRGNNDAVQSVNVQSDALKAQRALEAIANDWIKAKNVTVDRRIPTSLAGGRFNGLQISGRMFDPKQRFTIRMFCDYPNTRVTVIGVIGTSARVLSKNSHVFLDSLEMWQ